MIRLNLMKAWFDTVDSERRSPLAEEMAGRWFTADSDPLVRCGPASSNFICRVTAQGRTYFLRCNHDSERTFDDYAAEMDFVGHVGSRGVRVARPVRSRIGALVERVPTSLGTFYAVLLEEAVGVQRELMGMDEPSLQTWGATMAGLHSAAEGYAGRGRPSWQDHLLLTKNFIPDTEEAAHYELAVVTTALGALQVDATEFGLIHFDLEADNMVWHDGVPTVFDFDDSAHYWFAADIAYALRDLYDDRIERIDLTDSRLQAFVAGYRTVRPLPDRQMQLLPLFMRAHNLYWFARLQRSVAEGSLPREPSWTTDLRAALVNTMNGFRDGFERQPVSRYLP